MRRYRYAGQNKGFTLLEFTIVIIIISILFVMAIDRILKVEVEAERVAVQQVIGTLQSALAIEIAAHVARGKIKELHKLAGTNPIDRLSELPHNYIGEFDQVDASKIETRQWYFDKQHQTLVYRVKNGDYLKTNLAKPERIRLQIIPVYDDLNKDGRFSADIDTIKGLRIQALEPFEWTNEPIEATSFVEQELSRNNY